VEAQQGVSNRAIEQTGGWQGAAERATGMYMKVHEDRERAATQAASGMRR